jgi:hypothetical protein
MTEMTETIEEQPYQITHETIKHRFYNPYYGDHRICNCGHTYYRHFDSYEAMRDVGCKYCSCDTFEEDPDSNGCISLSGEVKRD